MLVSSCFLVSSNAYTNNILYLLLLNSSSCFPFTFPHFHPLFKFSNFSFFYYFSLLFCFLFFPLTNSCSPISCIRTFFTLCYLFFFHFFLKFFSVLLHQYLLPLLQLTCFLRSSYILYHFFKFLSSIPSPFLSSIPLDLFFFSLLSFFESLSLFFCSFYSSSQFHFLPLTLLC